MSRIGRNVFKEIYMVKKGKSSRKKKKIINPDILKKIDTNLFVDRDLSWLKFNERVLYQAEDKHVPLLERVRFLTIYSSNLDEFYMKRVGELKRKIEVDPNMYLVSGLTFAQQFEKIRHDILKLNKIAEDTYVNSIRPALITEGIHPLEWKELSKNEIAFLDKYFDENLFPVLTPLAYDSSHPFPFISNLSSSIGVALKSPDTDELIFARVKIPKFFSQWIFLPETSSPKHQKYASLLDVIINNLHKLFSGMKIEGIMPFRITRNADWDPDDKNESIVQKVEEAIKDRKFAECIRLQYYGEAHEWLLNLLKETHEIKDEDIYKQDKVLDFSDLKSLVDIEAPKLKHKTWVPIPIHFNTEDPSVMFNEIAKKDIMVHHPYESFSESVEKFIRLAANDPHVVAIKMTLYRTNEGSTFVKSLIHAAEKGKQVAVLIELQARFDEERNLNWGNLLENAGVHVVYGIPGYKIHTKTALVIRKENDGHLKSYAHIGTGNYNSLTSNVYTDLGIFTANKTIGGDLIQLFHFLTGKSLFNNFQSLLVAPFNMKKKFIDLIDREIAIAKEGKEAVIMAKVNSFDEIEITEKLYEASKAGVKIKLFVRGFCTLKPKLAGVSDNIEVYSIIGRFLEHSRIFYFKNNQDKVEKSDFFIGSADWMYRNLQNRVEVITPVDDKDLKKYCFEVFDTMTKDNVLKWEMKSNGEYEKVKSTGKAFSTHEHFMNKKGHEMH